jgi:hypothetical protein
MSWMDEIFHFVMGGRKPDGTLDECQLDGDKNLKVVVVGTLTPPIPPPVVKAGWDDPPGYLAQRTVKGSAGVLFQFFGFSDTPGYVHLFDAALPPPDGTVPNISLVLWGYGSPFSLPLSAEGRDFTKGIVWVFSKTPEVLTRDAAAKVWVNAQRL